MQADSLGCLISTPILAQFRNELDVTRTRTKNITAKKITGLFVGYRNTLSIVLNGHQSRSST
jgi:hypothetical protein